MSWEIAEDSSRRFGVYVLWLESGISLVLFKSWVK
jgi:hypothetical protein